MEQATQDKVASRATGPHYEFGGLHWCTALLHRPLEWSRGGETESGRGSNREGKRREDKMGLVMQFGKCNKLEIVLRFGSVFHIICIHTFE